MLLLLLLLLLIPLPLPNESTRDEKLPKQCSPELFYILLLCFTLRIIGMVSPAAAPSKTQVYCNTETSFKYHSKIHMQHSLNDHSKIHMQHSINHHSPTHM